MATVDLGQLEEVGVREVWPDEARDFTPWLAKNLDQIGEALHLNLTLAEEEGKVGDFAVDIVADEDVHGLVVIENQLERTDHEHLGKLLTYAAGRDARVLIWVTTEFRDEHRAALDWLNRWTTEEIEVYGVEVRVKRIGGSLPAPQFRPVVVAASWSRRARKRLGLEQTTADHSRELLPPDIGPVAADVDREGIRWNASFHSVFEISAELLIETEDPRFNLLAYEWVSEERNDIAKSLGGIDEWEGRRLSASTRSIHISKKVPFDSVSNPLEVIPLELQRTLSKIQRSLESPIDSLLWSIEEETEGVEDGSPGDDI